MARYGEESEKDMDLPGCSSWGYNNSVDIEDKDGDQRERRGKWGVTNRTTRIPVEKLRGLDQEGSHLQSITPVRPFSGSARQYFPH
ncbi:hypothetical protein RRG08_001066 [Elysia crispata]|uniref:Uncharacterized protein n=1 Tax=Elysia crispata TaxID=231223 RepID=A0AAE1AVT3_9GAST|nr:hypothetical protein RRG08_001066 [Elysia crispata]